MHVLVAGSSSKRMQALKILSKLRFKNNEKETIHWKPQILDQVQTLAPN